RCSGIRKLPTDAKKNQRRRVLRTNHRTHTANRGRFAGMGLLAFAVALFLVLLQHRSRGYFGGALAVAAGLLRVLLDVFILPLLFGSDSANVLSLWHLCGSWRELLPASR